MALSISSTSTGMARCRSRLHKDGGAWQGCQGRCSVENEERGKLVALQSSLLSSSAWCSLVSRLDTRNKLSLTAAGQSCVASQCTTLYGRAHDWPPLRPLIPEVQHRPQREAKGGA